MVCTCFARTEVNIANGNEAKKGHARSERVFQWVYTLVCVSAWEDVRGTTCKVPEPNAAISFGPGGKQVPHYLAIIFTDPCSDDDVDDNNAQNCTNLSLVMGVLR
ncbi:hypothetical protein ZHAS_00014514 [Anopheles sinensis]|uniref:Uncharacterized protein n=1 Tax=Anopheles sinensis TaxID=74873 RepID=A0A084W8H8_ANOSI|nr:hypothetical protein ZHAS_00014514 [Anopheles sinensis]